MGLPHTSSAGCHRAPRTADV